MKKLYIFLFTTFVCTTILAQNVYDSRRGGSVVKSFIEQYQDRLKDLPSNEKTTFQNFPDTTLEVWVAHYNGPNNLSDVAQAITIDNSGNIYVTGGSEGMGTGYDMTTIKYNSAGVEEWVARYNGAGNGEDIAVDIVVDNAGNIYVTGWSEIEGPYNFDYVTIKYNSMGTELWTANYDGPLNDEERPFAMAIDSSGNVYVTGMSISASFFDYATVKYNSMGAVEWVARYDGGGFDADQAWDIAVDDAGSVYVTGNGSSVSDGFDYVTIKYNAMGTEDWVARYHGGGGPMANSDIARAIDIDESGNVYVTGESNDGTSTDFVTIKYSPSGLQEWVGRYDGHISGSDFAGMITVDELGNIYVAGFSEGAGTLFDYAVIKYNSMLVEEWTARYNNEQVNGDDACFAMVVDNSNNVYLTGRSQSTLALIDADYATVKFNENGVQEWVAEYNGIGNGNDIPYGIAVDNSGYVYVTGQSQGSGTLDDYCTLKYEQVTIPVELTSFTANVTGHNVILNWVTATETNNQGFNVERSQHSEFKNQDWEKIGFVAGNGTVTEKKSYSFSDKEISAGAYFYRLKQIDYDGSYEYSQVVGVEVSIPEKFSLSQNYPNPFNPTTKINFSLGVGSYVTLKVFDALGQEITTLVNGNLEAGNHSITYNSSKLNSGVYIYIIEANGIEGSIFTSTKKMIVIK